MSLITTTAELQAFCAALAGTEYVTVDTEFMRERTYYAKLCLIQLGGPHAAVAVDPLAEGIDLAPLYALLQDPSILKVFHAARQDIEIFVNLTGCVPTPIFDTQVAGMVCGFGDAASYETLATTLAGAKIDKSSRFTDWAHRPLTSRQIDYALADVTHLRKVYDKLSARLAKTGRAAWVDEEMAILTNLKTYQLDPYEIWRRFKLRSDKPRARAVLRELAAWREKEAQRANLPRARIMKDETLLEIAQHQPTTAQDLARTRGLPQGYAEGKHGIAILDAIQRGLDLPADQCPAGDARRNLPSGIGATVDLLKVLLHKISDENDVATKLIASSEDLDLLAAEDEPDIKPLKGWRRTLFGETALALKKGEIALAINKRKITTYPIKA